MSEAWAKEQDAADPSYRTEFHLPLTAAGQPMVYLCGNSLGLQPKGAREAVLQELDDWARLGVEGHFQARLPWYDYHEFVRDDMAAIVGAQPLETVVMNALTVNLHLMLTSFYRPQGDRTLILAEAGAFPSDRYALQSHVACRGLTDVIQEVGPREGEAWVREGDLVDAIEQAGNRLALVLFSGVSYYSGQVFPIEAMTAAAHRVGALAGWDLAHAAGNLDLRLHDWDVDFAAWCSYKYLNGGPGGVGACFVHERHGDRADLPRLAGWWGNDPGTRFTMPDRFEPQAGAAGWQLSNAPVLSMAALRPSLALFRQASMATLRARSIRLTQYLRSLLSDMDILTPPDSGCQLSLRLGDPARSVCDALQVAGICTDYRAPDVVRVAPVPLYNTFLDVWTFASQLRVLLNQ